VLVVIVFFFLIESKDRSLEEIDTMYMKHVNPITSHKWNAAEGRKQSNDQSETAMESSQEEN
jgi:SP family sugar:H+ symporter-like MFS transporter